ncbi:MAG: nicotinate (nicotinamide) nucleotide adenylyltransferase [Oculatellaceae cyanobacterium Prado106]|jgi:nicotinate-nucleotide adenylyltransferase|nr:nicotinate (nicotinamide) nucleotide adenylyltransferase [Oculatellaceae cyanobacterium Prado106]
MQKIAILGGTFNPVHCGHIAIAETALTQFNLDQVIWVPTANPPHKLPQDLVAFGHRAEMVRRAIAPYPSFLLSEIEAQRITAQRITAQRNQSQRSGRSFAIDTWRDLQVLYPQPVQWFWIIGRDTFQTLTRWPGFEELASHCIWIVAPRAAEGEEFSGKIHSKVRWEALKMTPIEISASQIRQRCQNHLPIDAWVPPAVLTYLLDHRLYQNG